VDVERGVEDNPAFVLSALDQCGGRRRGLPTRIARKKPITAKAEQKCQTKEELHHSSDFLLPPRRSVRRLEADFLF
ncbi:MAG: hypothetical protein ACXWXT_11390, partial [Candidatus Binatia bacterium]